MKSNNTKKPIKAPVDASAVDDARFAEVYSDPRFMRVPQKMKKIVIDERFKKVLKKDKEFNLVQKVDKYGKRVNKQDNTMAAFYHLDDGKKMKKEEADSDNEEEVVGVKKTGGASKYYDDEGKFKWEAQSSSEEEQMSDEESSADIEDIKPSKREILSEDEEDDEEEQVSDMDADVRKMQPKSVPRSEVIIGKRLALTNMDWDNLTAVDILAIFTSLCKGGDMFVRKVEIYPSLFGLEQMKKDTLYGPPKELFEAEEDIAGKKKKKTKAGELFDEEDEAYTNAFNQG